MKLITPLIICSFALAPLASAQLFAPSNLGFEDDGSAGVFPSGWLDNSPTALAETSTDYVHSGSYSLIIDSTGAGAWAAPYVSQEFDATPGVEYGISAYMLMPASNPITDASFGLLKIEFRDSADNLLGVDGLVSVGSAAGGTFPGAESIQVKAGDPADQWIFAETVVTAPAGAVKAGFLVMNINQAVDPSVLYYDSVSIIPEPSTYALVGGMAMLLMVLVRKVRRRVLN